MTCKSSKLEYAMVALVAVLALAVETGYAAGSYKLEAFNSAPPAELAAAVRDTLSPDAVRVVGPQGPLLEIWWRKTLPAQANPAQGLGIAYGQLAEGTLVGAMRIIAPTADYRNQQTRPGVYTMRYALIPDDGNHYYVAPNRDFVLLAPAASDPDPMTISIKDLIILSRKASGTGHASVWSLPQADSPPASMPSLVHVEDGDLWVLSFRAQLEPPGGTPSPLMMEMVVVGHTPEA